MEAKVARATESEMARVSEWSLTEGEVRARVRKKSKQGKFFFLGSFINKLSSGGFVRNLWLQERELEPDLTAITSAAAALIKKMFEKNSDITKSSNK